MSSINESISELQRIQQQLESQKNAEAEFAHIDPNAQYMLLSYNWKGQPHVKGYEKGVLGFLRVFFAVWFSLPIYLALGNPIGKEAVKEALNNRRISILQHSKELLKTTTLAIYKDANTAVAMQKQLELIQQAFQKLFTDLGVQLPTEITYLKDNLLVAKWKIDHQKLLDSLRKDDDEGNSKTCLAIATALKQTITTLQDNNCEIITDTERSNVIYTLIKHLSLLEQSNEPVVKDNCRQAVAEILTIPIKNEKENSSILYAINSLKQKPENFKLYF